MAEYQDFLAVGTELTMRQVPQPQTGCPRCPDALGIGWHRFEGGEVDAWGEKVQ